MAAGTGKDVDNDIDHDSADDTDKDDALTMTLLLALALALTMLCLWRDYGDAVAQDVGNGFGTVSTDDGLACGGAICRRLFF